MKLRVRNFFSNNKKESIILIAILLLGGFFRLYKIGGYMTFLGDEGRDAIIVRRLLVDFDPILIGPRTSIGNMYLGPLYYYLIAPALFVANFSPVGPSVLIALIGVITILFIWYVVREWFYTETQMFKSESTSGVAVGALVAAFLYAIAPVVIIYSRSSWNPNIMPFFALLSIYSIWRVWIKSQYRWLLVSGFSTAFVLQSHYLGLILVSILGVFWLFTFLRLVQNENKKVSILRKMTSNKMRNLLINSTFGLVIFAFLMSPLVIFDARHEWRNYESMKIFFTQRQTTVNAKPWKALNTIWSVTTEISERLVSSYNKNLGLWSAVFLAVGVTLYSFKAIKLKRRFEILIPKKNEDLVRYQAFFLLFVWIGFALFGLSLYKQEIYDHYYGFFFATPFILIGGLSQIIFEKKNLALKVLLILYLVTMTVSALQQSPLKFPPNRQLERSEVVSQKMIDESGGERFNIAVIAERNYEGAYQYYLERKNANFVIIDPQRTDDTIAEQLYVVCELPRDECDPTHNGKAEVANFGWSKIDKEWEVFGTTLFKLVHSK